ncbi:MAG: glycosyltransferase [Bacteroidales bacterium]
MSRPLCTINPYTLEKQFRNRETEQEASQKILIITYYWPPCGGAGVQRWLKFSKYLPELGWEPYVVTVDPRHASFPAIDKSLEAEVHPSVRVYKTRAINWFRLFSTSGPAEQKESGNRRDNIGQGSSGSKESTGGLRGSGSKRYASDTEGIGSNGDTGATRGRSSNGDTMDTRGSEEIGFTGSADESASTASLMVRISRFIRGNFFIPDPRRGWNRYAYRMASKIIREEKIGYVVTTSPPHSTQLIGLRLKKRFPQIKWIADLRDPWTGIYYYSMFSHTRLATMLDAMYEKRVLRQADRIITVGNSLKNEFEKRGGIPSEKIEILYNGYDRTDFTPEGETEQQPAISYVGSLTSHYPLEGFINALDIIADEIPVGGIRFIGNIPGEIKEKLETRISADKLIFSPYTSHNKAVKAMSSSSILLIVIPQHPGNKAIITGKLFEYLATGNHILCIGPADGDAAEIIERSSQGKTFGYSDEKGIAEFIKEKIREPRSENDFSLKYERRSVTEDLVRILEQS